MSWHRYLESVKGRYKGFSSNTEQKTNNYMKNPFTTKITIQSVVYWILFAMSLSALAMWYSTTTLNEEVSKLLSTNEQLTKIHYGHFPKSTNESSSKEYSPESLGGKPRKITTSCYTSVESTGANGRNEWSVATYLYPQGTHLYIEGIGEKVVETVTAKRFSNRIDIWFGDKYNECKSYGLQVRNVWVLTGK